VVTSHRCFCISSTTFPLPSSASPRSGCAQVQRLCFLSLRSVSVLWATTFKIYRQQRDFAAGISAPLFFGVGSRPSPPFLSFLFLNSLVLTDI
jgi:hypothetical protein